MSKKLRVAYREYVYPDLIKYHGDEGLMVTVHSHALDLAVMADLLSRDFKVVDIKDKTDVHKSNNVWGNLAPGLKPRKS